VHALVATGVNADGHREVVGVQVTSSEDGAGCLGFFLLRRRVRGDGIHLRQRVWQAHAP
jgi:transposase-like protein